MSFDYLKKFFDNISEVKKGYKVFKKIREAYPDHVICVNQHPSLGDSYLMALYLPQYYKARKYVVTTIGTSSADVYRYMNITDIVVLDQCRTDQLISFARMSARSNAVKVLHHQAIKWHIGIAWQLQGANGSNFADFIEGVVFKGMTRADRRYPDKIKVDADIFYQKDLHKGNSVILFPYANTLPTPPKEYWEDTVRQKSRQGKEIYTHVRPGERPIMGTRGIELELTEIVAAAEYAGEVICARSGLADLLGTADCIKTIIYPSGGAPGWIHGELSDFWSVNGFGYCNDAIEITFDM